MKMHFVKLIFYAHIKEIKFNDHCLRGWSMNPLCKPTIFGIYTIFSLSVHDSMQNMQVIKQLIQNPTEKKINSLTSKTHNIL